MSNQSYAPQVFLSYSFKDLYAARRLSNALSERGLEVFPKRIFTPGSESWRANLKNAIARSACVVLILSPDTLASRWVELAFRYAQEYSIPIVPAVVSGQAGHVMLAELDGDPWFDLRRNSSYEREIESLAMLVRVFAAQQIVESYSS